MNNAKKEREKIEWERLEISCFIKVLFRKSIATACGAFEEHVFLSREVWASAAGSTLWGPEAIALAALRQDPEELGTLVCFASRRGRGRLRSSACICSILGLGSLPRLPPSSVEVRGAGTQSNRDGDPGQRPLHTLGVPAPRLYKPHPRPAQPQGPASSSVNRGANPDPSGGAAGPVPSVCPGSVRPSV